MLPSASRTSLVARPELVIVACMFIAFAKISPHDENANGPIECRVLRVTVRNTVVVGIGNHANGVEETVTCYLLIFAIAGSLSNFLAIQLVNITNTDSRYHFNEGYFVVPIR